MKNVLVGLFFCFLAVDGNAAGDPEKAKAVLQRIRNEKQAGDTGINEGMKHAIKVRNLFETEAGQLNLSDVSCIEESCTVTILPKATQSQAQIQAAMVEVFGKNPWLGTSMGTLSTAESPTKKFTFYKPDENLGM